MANLSKAVTLTEEQKTLLLGTINSFKSWLCKALPRTKITEYTDFKFLKPVHRRLRGQSYIDE